MFSVSSSSSLTRQQRPQPSHKLSHSLVVISESRLRRQNGTSSASAATSSARASSQGVGASPGGPDNVPGCPGGARRRPSAIGELPGLGAMVNRVACAGHRPPQRSRLPGDAQCPHPSVTRDRFGPAKNPAKVWPCGRRRVSTLLRKSAQNLNLEQVNRVKVIEPTGCGYFIGDYAILAPIPATGPRRPHCVTSYLLIGSRDCGGYCSTSMRGSIRRCLPPRPDCGNITNGSSRSWTASTSPVGSASSLNCSPKPAPWAPAAWC